MKIMEITRLNHSCFRIKGKKAIILIEPDKEIKNLTSQIVLFSKPTDQELKLKGEPVIIYGPGEYEIKQVRILGMRENKTMIYKIKMDGLALLSLNRLPKKISEEKIELLNQPEILFLPVSQPKEAVALIAQLEPLIVIPIEEKGIEDFLKEEETEGERLSKLVVTKEELPEERKIIILKKT